MLARRVAFPMMNSLLGESCRALAPSINLKESKQYLTFDIREHERTM